MKTKANNIRFCLDSECRNSVYMSRGMLDRYFERFAWI